MIIKHQLVSAEPKFLDRRLFHSEKHFKEFGVLCNTVWDEIEVFPTRRKNLPAKKKLLSCLLYNLYSAWKGDRPLAISKARDYYNSLKKNHRNTFLTYGNLMAVLKALQDAIIIYQSNGYYDRYTGKGERTRLYPCSWLEEQFTRVREERNLALKRFKGASVSPKGKLILPAEYIREKPSALVVIKDGKVRSSSSILKMEKFLREYNSRIAQHVILIPSKEHSQMALLQGEPHILSQPAVNSSGRLVYTHPTHSILGSNEVKPLYYQELDCQLYRVFNRSSLRLGGRYYGAEYQSYPSKSRSQILIDDNPVSELDYASLHPTILFNLNDMDIPGLNHPDFDFYDIYQNRQLRGAVKLIVNIAINAGSRIKALNAFNFKLKRNYSNPDKSDKFLKILMAMDEHKLTPGKTLNDFLYNYPELSESLYTDKGIELMNIDSMIATDVLGYFHRKNIPCLCIHDSYIVPAEHKEELHHVMEQTYFAHLNHSIKISEK
jgi:hypothetical protein